MDYGRIFVVKVGDAFVSVPPTKKGVAPVLESLSQARFYRDVASARKVATDCGGAAVAVDLAVNTSVQTYTQDEDRFAFSRNGLSCDPPPGWRTIPPSARVAFLSATGWIRL